MYTKVKESKKEVTSKCEICGQDFTTFIPRCCSDKCYKQRNSQETKRKLQEYEEMISLTRIQNFDIDKFREMMKKKAL